MSENDSQEREPRSLLETWLKTSAEFWETTLRTWPGMPEGKGTPGESKSAPGSRAQESWATAFKTWEALASLMAEPGSVEGIVQGINTFPQILSKLMMPAWQGLFHLQREWLERANRIGKSTVAYQFEDLDSDLFKTWGDIYEREFKQFLNIPQLGLARVYQERAAQAADKFNVFQTTVAEFLSLLYLPIEKSFKVMQEQLALLADEGALPEQSREYYRMWIKTLEGHYMTLFQSPEYVETLRRILDATGEFLTAKQRFLQDALKALPVPNQEDMDELYKEIYLLKKRVKELEKKSDHQEEPYIRD